MKANHVVKRRASGRQVVNADQPAGELRRIAGQHQAHIVQLDQGAHQRQQVLAPVVAAAHPVGLHVARPQPIEQVVQGHQELRGPLAAVAWHRGQHLDEQALYQRGATAAGLHRADAGQVVERQPRHRGHQRRRRFQSGAGSRPPGRAPVPAGLFPAGLSGPAPAATPLDRGARRAASPAGSRAGGGRAPPRPGRAPASPRRSGREDAGPAGGRRTTAHAPAPRAAPTPASA